ncbi:hypothetical protein C8Q79DRAFT_392117 [Trametes meyenii]|nr:hypothetical protein C8Q79DRAFT_392117 [Trametes meyenii]
MNATNGTASSLINGRPNKNVAGPILVQAFLQYLCQGVIISQSTKFYQRWEDDPVALRVYVVILLLFSLLQTVLESYKTWIETIDGQHWWTSRLHCTEFLCNALICALCEAFLIRRCYRITQRSIAVLIFMGLLLLTTVVATVVLTIRIAQVIGPRRDNGYGDPLHASMFAYPLWVYSTLVMALSLTTILSVSLWRNRTGLQHLDRTLTHIIFITFESAALPTACMVLSAIIYCVRDATGAPSFPSPSPLSTSTSTAGSGAAAAPHPPHVHMAPSLHLDLFFAILTGKVYTLGILRTLNSRTQFRAGLHTSHLGRRSLTGWDWATADTDTGGGGGEGAAGGEMGCQAVSPAWERMRGSAASTRSGSSGGSGGARSSVSSDATVRPHGVAVAGVGAAVAGSGVAVQAVPSAHSMISKPRKSFSKGSCRENGRTWHSPPP